MQKLIKRTKVTRTTEINSAPTNKDKCVVIPYAHRLSHGLKNVAGRFNVKVLLSAPNKMKNICGIVDRKLLEKRTGSNKKTCKVKHISPVVPCRVGVVYQIPFSCGHVYIGQTGRCLNIRLMEHQRSLVGNPYSHLAKHSTEHACTPMFQHTVCIFAHADQATREIMEAFYIFKKGPSCVSVPSITLHDREIAFLNCFAS